MQTVGTRKDSDVSALLESYAAGRWFRADNEGEPRLDASTGGEVASVSGRGLDLGGMVDHARRVGGPAIRELTFHERAGLLKALGKHLSSDKDEQPRHADLLVEVEPSEVTVVFDGRSTTTAMPRNYALEPDEVDQGFVLTCQTFPVSDDVTVDFDA